MLSNFKNLNDQARSSRPETVDSEAMLQETEANLASSTWRVSGELTVQCGSSPS